MSLAYEDQAYLLANVDSCKIDKHIRVDHIRELKVIMFSAACEKWTIFICSMERSSCISFMQDTFKEATHFSPLPVNLGKLKNNLLDFCLR